VRWPDLTLTAVGALLGGYFGPDGLFLLVPPALELIWPGIWLGSSVGVLVALLATRRARALSTALWHLGLAAVTLSLVLASSRGWQHYGPWLEEPAFLAGAAALFLAAIFARFMGTRHGPVVAEGWRRISIDGAGALAGAMVGFAAGYGVGGLATDLIPCQGFECGMGTFLSVALLAIPVGAGAGALVALLAARGSREAY